jgi:hypothetical protein
MENLSPSFYIFIYDMPGRIVVECLLEACNFNFTVRLCKHAVVIGEPLGNISDFAPGALTDGQGLTPERKVIICRSR